MIELVARRDLSLSAISSTQLSSFSGIATIVPSKVKCPNKAPRRGKVAARTAILGATEFAREAKEACVKVLFEELGASAQAAPWKARLHEFAGSSLMREAQLAYLALRRGNYAELNVRAAVLEFTTVSSVEAIADAFDVLKSEAAPLGVITECTKRLADAKPTGVLANSDAKDR